MSFKHAVSSARSAWKQATIALSFLDIVGGMIEAKIPEQRVRVEMQKKFLFSFRSVSFLFLCSHAQETGKKNREHLFIE
jgi:hypothetical protein